MIRNVRLRSLALTSRMYRNVCEKYLNLFLLGDHLFFAVKIRRKNCEKKYYFLGTKKKQKSISHCNFAYCN